MVKVEIFVKDTGEKRWTEFHETEALADEAIEQMKMNVYNPDVHIVRKSFVGGDA